MKRLKFVIYFLVLSFFFIGPAAEASIDQIIRDAMKDSAVNYLQDNGVLQAEAGEYSAEITRAEILRMAMAAGGVPLDVYKSDYFTDVFAHSWWAPYIWKAADVGWVRGFGDGTFRPDNAVTVAEALKIISQVLNVEVGTASPNEDWFIPYMKHYADKGLFRSDRSVGPNTKMKKIEVYETLYHLLLFLKGEMMPEPYPEDFADLVEEEVPESLVTAGCQPDPEIDPDICFFGKPRIMRDAKGCYERIYCERDDFEPPVVKVLSPTVSPVRESTVEIVLEANEPVACEFRRSCVKNMKTMEESCAAIDETEIDWTQYSFGGTGSFVSEVDDDSRYDITLMCVDRGGNVEDVRIIFDTNLGLTEVSLPPPSSSTLDFPEVTGILKVKLASDPRYGERGSPTADMKVFGFEVVSRSGNTDIRMAEVTLTITGGVTATDFKLYDASDNTVIDTSGVTHLPGSITRLTMSYAGTSSTQSTISGGGSKRYYLEADVSATTPDQSIHVQIADLGNRFSGPANPGDLIFDIRSQADKSVFNRVFWVDQSPNSVVPPPMTFSSF